MREELERLSRWLGWPTIASPPLESNTNTDTKENRNTENLEKRNTITSQIYPQIYIDRDA